jgi:hypothetical protein
MIIGASYDGFKAGLSIYLKLKKKHREQHLKSNCDKRCYQINCNELKEISLLI